MSRLGCFCGFVMSNTEDPDPCAISVYTSKEIEDAVNHDPNLKWLDLETDWDEINDCHRSYMQRPENVEYWYCPSCKRVYEVSIQHRRWVRVYKRMKTLFMGATTDWKKLYVFPDKESWDAVENTVGDLSAQDFVYNMDHPYEYKLSPDQTHVVAFDSKTKEVAFSYELEEEWHPSAENTP